MALPTKFDNLDSVPGTQRVRGQNKLLCCLCMAKGCRGMCAQHVLELAEHMQLKTHTKQKPFNYKLKVGTVEIGQRLRMLTAFPKDLSSLPSTHVQWFITASNSRQVIQCPLLAPAGRHTYGGRSYIHHSNNEIKSLYLKVLNNKLNKSIKIQSGQVKKGNMIKAFSRSSL